MKTLSTAERDWTDRERELAEEIRAQGNEVRCTIRNGRRVFEIMAGESGERVTLHLGGAVRITDKASAARRDMRVLRGVR